MYVVSDVKRKDLIDLRTYRTRRFTKRLVSLFPVVCLVVFMVACGTTTTAPQQPIKARVFSLSNKGVYPNNGSDVYVADTVTNLVSADSWHESATLTLPQHFSCPKDGTHRGVAGWVGLYAGNLQNGHFYQGVVANFCDGWYFQLSDLPVANGHAQKPVLIDTASSPDSIPSGARIDLTLDYDGTGNYTASFTLAGQTYSASLSNGLSPNQPQFGIECPKLVSGYVKSPAFDAMTLADMSFNGVRLNQWAVTQYETSVLKETKGLTTKSNSFTVTPAAA